VPIARGIEKIASHYPRATCVLCRRLMYRIATEVAREERALGIVTGYSLGQVASQTAENIMAEEAGIEVPVYHPLIAMDKTQITEQARRIGTYQVTESTRPCSAVPRKPLTKARLEEILALEEELGLRDLARALAAEMSLSKI
jgi:thiamine biosynthesis protein ThiI